jgi:hypothetical protein
MKLAGIWSPGWLVFTVAAPKDPAGGGGPVGGVLACTVTTTLWDTEPVPFAAVKLYVVVLAGDTCTDVPVTVPIPLTLNVVAPVTLHCSRDDWPP